MVKIILLNNEERGDNMKKINLLGIALSALTAVSLTGCFGGGSEIDGQYQCNITHKVSYQNKTASFMMKIKGQDWNIMRNGKWVQVKYFPSKVIKNEAGEYVFKHSPLNYEGLLKLAKNKTQREELLKEINEANEDKVYKPFMIADKNKDNNALIVKSYAEMGFGELKPVSNAYCQKLK